MAIDDGTFLSSIVDACRSDENPDQTDAPGEGCCESGYGRRSGRAGDKACVVIPFQSQLL